MTSDRAPEHQPASYTLLLCLLVVAAIGISLVAASQTRGLFGALLGAIMVAIAACDARSQIIPDGLTAGAVVVALLYEGFFAPEPGLAAIVRAIVGGLAAAAPFLLLLYGYRAWRGRDGLGLGDVKLAAVAGVWLNWLSVIVAVDLAALSALAAIVLISRLTRKPLTATTMLPLGLFLAPAIWIGWLLETLLF